MSKVTLKANPMLCPVPAVMVSCGSSPEEYNILTVAWTGIVNSKPPMTYISVQPIRHSYEILKREQEFVINLTTEQLAYATDFCGVRSGRDLNKFETLGLTPQAAEQVKCPLIKESPVNLECRVVEMREFPSHHMFLAEIVAVHVDEDLVSAEGKVELAKAGLMCYSHGEYFGLAPKGLGRFGFSVMKEKTKKRIRGEERKKSGSRKRKFQKRDV